MSVKPSGGACADGHVVGVADHLDRPLRELRQDLRHLEQHGLALRHQRGLAGREEHAVEDVHGQLALELGDGDVAGIQLGAHLLFEALLRLGGLGDLLFQLGSLFPERQHLGGEGGVGRGGLLGEAARIRGRILRGAAGASGLADLEEPDPQQQQRRQDRRQNPGTLRHGTNATVPRVRRNGESGRVPARPGVPRGPVASPACGMLRPAGHVQRDRTEDRRRSWARRFPGAIDERMGGRRVLVVDRDAGARRRGRHRSPRSRARSPRAAGR